MELENSKLIQLLKKLNPVEVLELEKFINSSFFNTSEHICNLINILIKDYPEFKNIKKEQIFTFIYPNETFKDKKIRDIFSRTLKLTEEYLIQKEFSKKKFLKASFLLKQIASRNLEKHFIGKTRDLDLELEEEKLISSEFLLNKYLIYREKREFLSSLASIKNRAIHYGDITTEIELFTAYCIYNLLKFETIILVNKKQLKYTHKFNVLEHIIDYCNKYPMDEYPVTMIFYHLILLNRNPDNMNTYIKLKKLIDENIHNISYEDKLIVLVEQFNFTKIQSLKGIDFYRKENYRILKQNTDNEIYPFDGIYFNESSFITIADAAFKNSDFEWGENFIFKNIDKIDPKKQANVTIYLKGILHYRKGNHGEALKNLAKVSTDDFTYHFRVKNHQLKIYYEMDDVESVIRIADSYRHFLSGAKHMADYIKTRFINYVNFLTRICNTRLSGNLQNIIHIKNEILSINQETLENKLWLLEQINKLKL